MSIFDIAVENCQACCLSGLLVNKNHGKMFGFGEGKKDIMVVGINPSIRRDVGTKYAMYSEYATSGTSEGILKKCLLELGYSYEDVYFTNLLKCSTEDNSPPNINETNICFNNFFMQEYLLYLPIKIFCLGSLVYDYLTINNNAVSSSKIYKVYHHAYIKRSPDKFEEWKKQFLVGIEDEIS
jgi:uracil-DNA glycosylase family 4